MKENVDLFKGECDLTIKGAQIVTECCHHCSVTNSCSSFTFISTNNICYMKTCRNGANRGSMAAVMMQNAISGWLK